MDTVTYHNKSEGRDGDGGGDGGGDGDGGGPPGPGPVAGPPTNGTTRTTLRRRPDRGSHDRAVIHAILDAGWVAHVGFATGHGPLVIPTAYGRRGDVLHLHGSRSSQLARAARDGGVPVCVTVTLVDGLILARSAFHHSVQYRSVVVFGTATEITDPDERAAALAGLVDHVLPGRSAEARPADDRELRLTSVLAVPLDEASAKVSAGFPTEEPGDEDLPVWAGVVRVTTVAGPALPDEGTRDAGRPLPASVVGLLGRG